MREILFRGKRTDNGEWTEGDLYRKTDALGEKETIIFQDKGADAFKKNFVNSETVCQYTGLKDKNGKKIFEGDIVEYEDEAPGQYEYHDSLIINRGVIEYSEGCFYWTNAVNANLQDYVYKGVADCEVIGNIFDNLELLDC